MRSLWRETTANPHTNMLSRSKAQKRPRRNLFLMPTLDRGRQAKTRKTNAPRIQLICKRSHTPSPPIYNKQLNYKMENKSRKELTHEALVAVQDASASLAPVQDNQLVTKFQCHPQLLLQRKLQRRGGRKTIPNIFQYVYLWVSNVKVEKQHEIGTM